MIQPLSNYDPQEKISEEIARLEIGRLKREEDKMNKHQEKNEVVLPESAKLGEVFVGGKVYQPKGDTSISGGGAIIIKRNEEDSTFTVEMKSTEKKEESNLKQLEFEVDGIKYKLILRGDEVVSLMSTDFPFVYKVSSHPEAQEEVAEAKKEVVEFMLGYLTKLQCMDEANQGHSFRDAVNLMKSYVLSLSQNDKEYTQL